MPHLQGVFFRNGSYKFQYLSPRRYLDWKAKAEIKSVFKQNVKYDWWVWQEERHPCGGQQWWQEARMKKKKKKALHQVLSKATVFTSFDLLLAELPFPVICTKYLGPDTWGVSLNSTNGGKHKSRQCLTQIPAWGNSWHLDTWFSREMTSEKIMSVEIPYWRHVTTQIWVALPIGRAAWEIWLNQSGALPRSVNNTSSVLNFCARFLLPQFTSSSFLSLIFKQNELDGRIMDAKLQIFQSVSQRMTYTCMRSFLSTLHRLFNKKPEVHSTFWLWG